jgi:predicted RNA-binding Zn ribbon-like protein
VSEQEFDFVHPALDLVNSQHGRGADLLDGDRWLTGFIGRWGYRPAAQPGRRERQQLLALRDLMRRIVETLDQGEPPTAGDLAQLNIVLGARPVRRELTMKQAAFNLRLAPARRDWTWVLSELAASFAELLADGEIARIKVCDDPDCRFTFYDVTKNRSRRWCASTTCGNRHKVRQFRARQRAHAGPTDQRTHNGTTR